MSFKSVLYTSESRLPCGGCAPADVILCVNKEKVAPSICPGQEGQEDPIFEAYEYRYIQAQLIKAVKLKNSCGAPFWQYTFFYDDAQIVTGEVLLPADVTGAFCKGCLTTWVEDYVGNEPTLLINDDGTYTYTSPHACQTTFLPASAGKIVAGDYTIVFPTTAPSVGQQLEVTDVTGNTVTLDWV